MEYRHVGAEIVMGRCAGLQFLVRGRNRSDTESGSYSESDEIRFRSDSDSDQIRFRSLALTRLFLFPGFLIRAGCSLVGLFF